MDPSTERLALASLLEALDARAPDLLERVAGRPREGTFFGALERHGLQDLEVALVLAALSARLEGTATLTGSELVQRTVTGSSRRLKALSTLDGESTLLAVGFLVPEVVPAHAADALATTLRLGEHVFRLACDVFGRRPAARREPATGPYGTNADALADLRRLSLHYRRRAARIFHLDPWSGTGIEVLDDAQTLVDRARIETQRISERLASTSSTELPLLAMRHEHGLDLDALVILVTVLFQELVEGVGAVDAVDLVKLVSESEADLIRRRLLLRPLARKGLIQLTGAYAGKDLTADVSLPNEVVNGLLGSPGDIGADERLDFHTYLRRLDSSDPFFMDLEGEGPQV